VIHHLKILRKLDAVAFRMQEISHLHRGLDIQTTCEVCDVPRTNQRALRVHVRALEASAVLRIAGVGVGCARGQGSTSSWWAAQTPRQGVPQAFLSLNLLQIAPSAGAASGTREEQIWCVSRRELVYVGPARNHRGAVVHTYSHARSVCQTYEKRSFTLQGSVRRRAGRWSR
jgi:hypothetical protein